MSLLRAAATGSGHACGALLAGLAGGSASIPDAGTATPHPRGRGGGCTARPPLLRIASEHRARRALSALPRARSGGRSGPAAGGPRGARGPRQLARRRRRGAPRGGAGAAVDGHRARLRRRAAGAPAPGAAPGCARSDTSANENRCRAAPRRAAPRADRGARAPGGACRLWCGQRRRSRGRRSRAPPPSALLHPCSDTAAPTCLKNKKFYAKPPCPRRTPLRPPPHRTDACYGARCGALVPLSQLLAGEALQVLPRRRHRPPEPRESVY